MEKKNMRRLEQQREEQRIQREAEERRPRCVEVGPESLKLTKLMKSDNIEAFLTTFERGAEVHGLDRDKHATILAPQLTGKVRLTYATMTDADKIDFDRVK